MLDKFTHHKIPQYAVNATNTQKSMWCYCDKKPKSASAISLSQRLVIRWMTSVTLVARESQALPGSLMAFEPHTP